MKYLKYLFLLLLALSFAACGDDNDDVAAKGDTTTPSKADPEVVNRLEVPAIPESNAIIVSHWTVENGDSVMTYCFQYDAQKYHSKWVAFRFDAVTSKDVTGRSNNFIDDPSVSSSLWIGSNSFWSNNSEHSYDRGHLCASEDRVYSSAANANTFYMTNMSPQISSFNQGYWVTLEGQIQKLGRDRNFCDTLYVVKGGTIANDKILGYVDRPNGKKVAVPMYYFVALLKVKNKQYSSIGFWLKHEEKNYSYEKKAPLSEIKKTIVTIDQLEEYTGIDFFHNLPDQIEKNAEDLNEPSSWGFQ